jgi:hypothetical protein
MMAWLMQGVTVNNTRTLIVAQQCFYGYFMSPATIKRTSVKYSCKVPDSFV